MQNKKKLVVLSLVQFLLLLALLGSIMYFKQTANTFKIESQSLDPIEPLFGHFADLSYQFDSISEKDWKGKSDPKEGESVYVVFKKGSNNLYEFDYLTDKRPTKVKYIKAKVSFAYDQGDGSGLKIDIRHNLEKYYIPEKQMDEYNQPNQKYIVTVQHKKDRAVVKTVKLVK